MATITRRSTGWFVQIRRKGYEPEYKTLPTRDAAVRWGRERESRLDRDEEPVARKALNSLTLADLIRRYIREVTPSKGGAEAERLRLQKMLNAPMCELTLLALKPSHVASYRDARATAVKPGTIARELGLLHTIIEVARRDWGLVVPSNVVALVRRLPVRDARDRRLKPGEYDQIMEALKSTRNASLGPAIMFAIETAMRRGELLNLLWTDVDLTGRLAHIRQTKTGYSRTIPLTDKAISILNALPFREGRVFPLTGTAVRLAWNRVRERAGIPDLRFHDLRHEAISRFAEMGLSIVELSAISGHREPRMLFRYAHIRPSDLSKRLMGRSWESERRE